MEEALVALLQFIFELLLNIISYVPFDFPVSRRRDTPEYAYGILPAIIWLILGGLAGGASLLIVRHTIIHHSWLRIANVGISPVVSGYVSRAIATVRAKRDPFVLPRNHFWYAFSFSFAYAIIRFTYASRA